MAFPTYSGSKAIRPRATVGWARSFRRRSPLVAAPGIASRSSVGSNQAYPWSARASPSSRTETWCRLSNRHVPPPRLNGEFFILVHQEPHSGDSAIHHAHRGWSHVLPRDEDPAVP